VKLGPPDQVSSGGISIPPTVVTVPPGGAGGLFTPPAPPGTQPTPPVAVPPTGVTPPNVTVPPVSVVPVIRQSNGAKSGLNLLGDLERWGLPDLERVIMATLTMRGLTVKELRELCTKLPPRLLAELQITSNPDQPGGTGK
jgi:hypothetical protein